MRSPAVFLLLLPAPALAEDAPSFDCAAARGAAEVAICADPELARLDRLLSARYAAALDAAGSLDAGAEAAEAALRATQRGWIGGRDACWKADDLTACITDVYLDREGQLVARWMLDDPVSTAVWRCGGTPANEVVTMFFDTERPSVRFERGDTIATGSLGPTGSGARYDGDFGRYIWIKGDEAIYRDPDPTGTEWTCVQAD